MNINMKYPWIRFWASPNSQINLTDGGFLHNPNDSVGKYINPNLTTLNDLIDSKCLVLLGEPGIGKSTEINNLCKITDKDHGHNSLWINLGDMPTFDYFLKELESDQKYQKWIKNDKPLFLFLDSFDEGVFEFKSFANFFIYLLTKNQDKISNLFLRISCRTAIWPSYFEDRLKVIFGEKQFRKYELCPLTKADVISALKSRGIDKEKFLKELNEKGATALAGKPLTLEFLMNIFEKNGSLLKRKDDIYSQGCNLLVQEPDPSKKKSLTMKSKLSLTQRIFIAERVAAATILGGKFTIVMDGDVGEGEVHISKLYGEEIINGSSLEIEEDQILEVLNTGLFSARGNTKVGWAHQTYGEFLAARCITRHQLDWKQVQSLLFQDPLKNNSFQVVPQLYEISAWLASLDSNFFDKAVLIDPEFLMLSDSNVITDSQKETLVNQLLLRLANGELFDRWETFNYANYKKLCHLNIAKQLQPYIKNSTKGIVARRSAIDIASACSTSSLEDILLKIALNDQENLAIRARATRALGEIGSNNAKKSLRSLMASGFKDDPEDELKGVTLQTLWPKYISTEELFLMLTPPKRHNFLGAYYSFIDNYLSLSIRREDTHAALNWVEKNAINTRGIEYYLGKLADAIMLKAWDNLFIPGILEKFAEIAYIRLKDFEELVGEHAVNDELVSSFQESIRSGNDKRKKLIKEIVKVAARDGEKNIDKKGYILLHSNKIRLVFSKDLSWFLQWLDYEKNVQIQKLLSEIICAIFDKKNVHDIESVRQSRNKNSFLMAETRYWFEPVRLDSEECKRERKQWQQMQKWEKRKDKNEREDLLRIISPKKIKELLEKAEAGDTDAWWQLHLKMCVYQHESEEEDIQKLPGWKVIDKDIQERIIRCAKPFILKQESKPEKWLGKGITYYPATAGYRALKILYEREKDFIEGLDEKVWEKWAPITVGMPLITNHPKNGELISIAYKKAPNEVIRTLDMLIDHEEQNRGNLFIVDLLYGCIDEKMSQFLLQKVQKKGFNPKAAGDILFFLLKHKVKVANEYVKSLIHVPLPTETEEKERLLIAAVSLLWNADNHDWDYLWNLIIKDKDFGHLLVEKAHENLLHGSGVLQNLNESQLAKLYVWLMKNFPPEKYFQPEGAHTVTPQISIGEWRDSVLRVLMEKGTPEAYRQITKIAKALPKYKWIKEYTLLQAKRTTLQKSWQPLTAKQILEMVKNREETHIMKSENQKIVQHFPTPPNTKWEEITIKFLDGHNVNVICHNIKKQINYKEMGFQDDRKRIPNKQWKLFELLSLKNGEISWQDKEATDKIKKQKQLLSDILREYFQIKEDPFYPYRRLKAYKIRIKLIPEQGTKIPEKKQSQQIPDSDIQDLLHEETKGSF